MAHLGGLDQLRTLDLSYTQITDAGLEHLKTLSQLRDLNLAVTHVTDAGLDRLAGMKQLRTFLALRKTPGHTRGSPQTKKALPNLQVEGGP